MISLTELPDLEILKGKENELNWEQRERLLASLTTFFNEQRTQLDYSLAGMSTFSGSFADLRASFQALPANDARFIISSWIKNSYEDILLILHTPRTQLSIRACTFLGSFATFLGPGLFDSFAENTLNHLIKLCGTTKKLIANCAAEVAKSISSLIVPQRAFPILLNGAIDKNVNCRLRAFECLKILSERNYEESLTISTTLIHQKIWENAVEKVLPKGISDANSDIRGEALNIFLIFKGRTPELANKFMEKLDVSTKKQLSLLLTKNSSASKASKPIVSTVPLAQIRKAMLKDHSEAITSDIETLEIPSSPVNRTKSTSPIRSIEKLSPSTLADNLMPLKPINRISPSKHTNSTSPSKLAKPSSLFPSKSTRLSPSKSAVSPSNSFSGWELAEIEMEEVKCTEVPMDEIQIPPTTPVLCSPSRSVKDLIQTFDKQFTNPPGSPVRVDSQSCDVFMDAQSCEILAEEEEIILNVPNAHYTSPIKLESLTKELHQKPEFDCEAVSTPLRHSISSPSIPLRIKTLGLAAGTPLRAIYRNASELELRTVKTLAPSGSLSNAESFIISSFPLSSNSLLSDLIEEFSNTKDEDCFKKILALTTVRTGDFDDLTSVLVSKLFQSLLNVPIDLKLKLLTNFLRNESFLLSSSGKEIIEILEESQDYQRLQVSQSQDTKLLINSICQSNLSQVLLENCIEMCCERLSEFKLILLAEFVKNYVGNFIEFRDQLQRSVTPLLLALNHPNLNMRRLSINCFLVARSKLNGSTESILQLLDEARVGLVQRRIIEEFLRQF